MWGKNQKRLMGRHKQTLNNAANIGVLRTLPGKHNCIIALLRFELLFPRWPLFYQAQCSGCRIRQGNHLSREGEMWKRRGRTPSGHTFLLYASLQLIPELNVAFSPSFRRAKKTNQVKGTPLLRRERRCQARSWSENCLGSISTSYQR